MACSAAAQVHVRGIPPSSIPGGCALCTDCRAAGQQQQQQELLFSFSKVLGGDTTQADVYAHTTDALVRSPGSC